MARTKYSAATVYKYKKPVGRPRKGTGSGFKKPTTTGTAFKRKPNFTPLRKKYATPRVPFKFNKGSGQTYGVDTAHGTSFLRATCGLGAKPQPKPQNNYITKLVKANVQKSIWRWSGISYYNNLTVPPLNQITTETGGGAYWLHNKVDSIGNRFVPVHLYDLTAYPNTIAGGFSNVNPTYQLTFSSSNNPAFYGLVNQDREGTTADGKWQQESMPDIFGSNSSLLPQRRTLLENINLKMLAYGAKGNACNYQIDFVQFTDEIVDPLFISVNGVVGRDLEAARAFWQQICKPFCSHPISDQSPMYKTQKFMKTLKSYKFTMQGVNTDEANALIPHQKNIKLYMPLNRILKYDWRETDTTALGDLVDPGAYTQNLGRTTNWVEPKARIYMMIRAFNHVQVAYTPGVSTIDITPSYDINIHSSLQNIG